MKAPQEKKKKTQQNYRPITPTNRHKTPQQTTIKLNITEHLKKIIHHDQVRFIQWM